MTYFTQRLGLIFLIVGSLLLGSTTSGQGAVGPGEPGCTLHLAFDDTLLGPPQVHRPEWQVRPGGPLLNRQEKGISSQGLICREPFDGIVLEPLGPLQVADPFVRGTFQCWFKPDWNSGEGPGHHATLAAFGQWRLPPDLKGFWGITIDPTGRQLQFGAQSASQGVTYLVAPIAFSRGQWYRITVSFAPEGSWIHVNDVQHGPGQGVSFLPPVASLQETGLNIGNAPGGNQPVQGLLDEIRWFNYPLQDLELEAGPWGLRGRVIDSDSLPPGILLSWPVSKGGPFAIRRRLSGKTKWDLLETQWEGFAYLDSWNGLDRGQTYQYQVQDRSQGGSMQEVSVAHSLGPKHHSGTILLLVDQTLNEALQKDLDLFSEVLRKDGWLVKRAQAPRHDDRSWRSNPERIDRTKQTIIQQLGQVKTEPRVVMLIGHVAVPYSGFHALDGHVKPEDDHRGAWPADMVYADLDGVWTDQQVDHVNRISEANTNVPGDGKFDQESAPTRLEVGVGRVDFANLPALNARRFFASSARRKQEEIDLIRRYLEKDILYRSKRLSFAAETLVEETLAATMGHKLRAAALTSGSLLYDSNAGKIRPGKLIAGDRGALWGFISGYGGPSTMVIGERTLQSEHFAQANSLPDVAFLGLYSSWHPDWNCPNAFMRAALSQDHAVLGLMSILSGPWDFQPLGLGGCLGDVFIASGSHPANPAKRSLAILGDPTLKTAVVAPVDDVKVIFRGEQRRLEWVAEDMPGREGYHAYLRLPGQVDYDLFQSVGPEVDHIVMPQEIPANSEFMVRQGQWQRTGSGSFVSLSLGMSASTP
jgi:hypothetical protein